MSTHISTASDHILRLGGTLCIYDVESLVGIIRQHLAEHDRLHLDLADITECDAAGLQLLLAARRSAEFAGKPFLLCAASSAVTVCAAAVGLSAAAFPLPSHP